MFALLGIVIFYFAWDATAVAAIDLAPGVLWVIFTFSGLLGMHRSFGVEQFDRAIDGLLASPVARESIFLGKAIRGFKKGMTDEEREKLEADKLEAAQKDETKSRSE